MRSAQACLTIVKFSFGFCPPSPHALVRTPWQAARAALQACHDPRPRCLFLLVL